MHFSLKKSLKKLPVSLSHRTGTENLTDLDVPLFLADKS